MATRGITEEQLNAPKDPPPAQHPLAQLDISKLPLITDSGVTVLLSVTPRLHNLSIAKTRCSNVTVQVLAALCTGLRTLDVTNCKGDDTFGFVPGLVGKRAFAVEPTQAGTVQFGTQALKVVTEDGVKLWRSPKPSRTRTRGTSRGGTDAEGKGSDGGVDDDDPHGRNQPEEHEEAAHFRNPQGLVTAPSFYDIGMGHKPTTFADAGSSDDDDSASDEANDDDHGEDDDDGNGSGLDGSGESEGPGDEGQGRSPNSKASQVTRPSRAKRGRRTMPTPRPRYGLAPTLPAVAEVAEVADGADGAREAGEAGAGPRQQPLGTPSAPGSAAAPSQLPPSVPGAATASHTSGGVPAGFLPPRPPLYQHASVHAASSLGASSMGGAGATPRSTGSGLSDASWLSDASSTYGALAGGRYGDDDNSSTTGSVYLDRVAMKRLATQTNALRDPYVV